VNEGRVAQDGLEGFVGLASALEVLRSELEAAWDAGQGKRVRFRVSQLTVTMQAVAGREREAGGKLRWYVLEAGAGAKSSAEATQTLELTLAPGLYDEHGNPQPLDVYGVQPQPGG
jgi:Trypsin-co-occurring domain 2